MAALPPAPLLLRALAINAENFLPYGDVIEAAPATRTGMNAERFDRFNDLAGVDVSPDSGGRACISIARCTTATALPYRFNLIERHPLGSQAFVPLGRFSFVVVVAPPGETVAASALRAFITNGRQGVNYRRGVWHMPLIALQPGQEFLVVDRGGAGDADNNYEERLLDTAVTLLQD